MKTRTRRNETPAAAHVLVETGVVRRIVGNGNRRIDNVHVVLANAGQPLVERGNVRRREAVRIEREVVVVVQVVNVVPDCVEL